MNAYEIAKIYGVSPVTVYRWAERGCPHKIYEQGTRYGKEFDLEQVKSWVKEEQKKHKK